MTETSLISLIIDAARATAVHASIEVVVITDMHIDNLSISSVSTDCRRNHDKCIFVHEIPYASLILGAVARVCDKVEFQGLRERENDKQDEEEFDDRRIFGAGRSHF